MNTAISNQQAGGKDETHKKSDKQSVPQFLRFKNIRLHMDTLSQVFLIISGIVIAIAAMIGIFAHNRDFVIWFTWLGVLSLCTSGFCWFQDREWKLDEEKKATEEIPHQASLVDAIDMANRPWVSLKCGLNAVPSGSKLTSLPMARASGELRKSIEA